MANKGDRGPRDEGHLILRVLQSERRILGNHPNEGPRVPSSEHPSDLEVLQSKAHPQKHPKSPVCAELVCASFDTDNGAGGHAHESQGLTRQRRPQLARGLGVSSLIRKWVSERK